MITVIDRGDYFLATYDGVDPEIWGKGYDGFRTAQELKHYLEHRYE